MANIRHFIRAFVLTTGVFSFLLWLYVVADLIAHEFNRFDPFIYWLPELSFYVVGILSFLLAAFCMLIYLTFWVFPREDLRGRGH